MINDTQQFLGMIGSGYMTSSAYDTAWIARLGDVQPDLSQSALNWLRESQLPDGSWGTPDFEYAHDRLICTLSAVMALAEFGSNGDQQRVERGRNTLDQWIGRLREDQAGETIGFELLIPTLMDDAAAMNLVSRRGYDTLTEMAARRTLKLVALPDKLINRHVTVAFSSEMVGTDAQILLDVDHLQEPNGSIGSSPSATAFFALNICPADPAALNYIAEITEANGGAPTCAPIDIFEIAWALWHLLLAYPAETLAPLVQQHLDVLEKAWVPQRGIGACSASSLYDSDDSAVVFEVLTRFGRSVSVDALLHYETSTHFRTYPIEANPSVSTNIHVLSALRAAGFDSTHPAVLKILKFLRNTRFASTYWYDKWHVSPYYTTAHATLALMGLDQRLVDRASNWILWSQNANGSWGSYLPTAEETAYALQALILWRRHGGDVPLETIKSAAGWLSEMIDAPYPMMWIGKSLYCPERVVKGTILSALALAEQEIGTL